ncbi:alpha/beta hydrolase family protein [Pseudoalteromonas luteoviolacea]|uniref:Peptidase S9 prolyl oligopeptidase catalytic domain-containing protein n=1 Tax=Pseudoalteromonas luteoviolacea S4054 TaxID=1129367 RepID=A0A0F6AIW6_9GAMM|nr:S9 family peptidase [Pseudoalteromonas luteoviolacea]AOT07897.1 hypothetical protein S4054249_08600 [Pseudoalteromonas luteoviolacea]AOT12813.1 hypothetical protein S40542_08600 [Pseudoalteromonas luteoviolacea]AOT17726.1 hypothetical protein S4054_08595 [Pseudoalteromonas luteoviolacea]KKE85864.1 hypothetical protein N479_00390 [Pseudoalteromonas luteoviolacea S4054]KZN74742.1 hypothetical protein N481_08770 [Pseudoalteromonas luteoviolacea S4047-1]
MPIALCFLMAFWLSTFQFNAYAHVQEKLPVEAYASLPHVSEFNLSPNGSKYAYVINNKGELILAVRDIASGKITAITRTDNLNAKLNWFDWLNNDILLFGISYTKRESLVRYTRTELLSFDLNNISKGAKLVVRPKRGQHNAQFKDHVISMLPDDPEHVLLSIDLKQPNRPGVYKLNVKKRKLKRVVRYKSNINSWVADRQGNVRMSYHRDETRIYYRLLDDKTSKWKTIFDYEVFSKDKVSVLGFDIDPSLLYIKAVHNDKDSIFKVDLKDPKLTRELVFHDPNYDVDGTLVYSPITGAVAGFSHAHVDNSIQYWDSDLQALQRSISQVLPGASNTIIDMDKTGTRYIVYSGSDKDPGSYLLGDTAKNSIQYLAKQYPLIDESSYLGKQLVEYTARDKVKIEGYITLPKGYESGRKYPAIVLPHGGPYARDYQGFDYWSEFFAHNGYIVLQPNFRGSYGYGFEFAQAAIGGWGKAMQDDLDDAAKWLVAQGYAEKNKMCIAGGSYGGYAAIMAVIKHPETFMCAASFAGVTDLESIYSQARYFTNKDVVRKQLGGDRSQLEKVSPVSLSEFISKPILLIHGTEDVTVPVSQSKKLVNKLRDRNKDVTYIELEDGDHHLSYQPHRIQTLKAMLVFFDKHLK